MCSRKPNKTLRFNLHAVAAVLLLTACGDESSSPTAPPTPPTPPTPVATSITLSATNLSFSSLGETSQLTATVKDQTGATMSAAGVTWATSSYSIATVSPSGLVTSVGNGTATITASSGSASGQTTVTVSQMVASLELSDTSISFSALGDTARAAVTLSDTNGNEIKDVDVDWATSDSTVVTVSTSGLFTAVATGTATITASSGSIDGVVTVSVSQVAAAITLSQNAIEFSVIGDTAQLNASVQDKNGNDISGADVVWATSDESIATVSSSGLVTAIAWGGVEITAAAGSVEERAIVASMLGLEIRVVSASDTVNAGTNVEVTVEVYRSDTSNPVAGVTGSVTWAGVIGTFVENSASAPAWDGNLLTNPDRVGRVQFAAASAAGVTGDPVEIIRFELRVDRIGTTQITPDLTELAVVDPVTGATTDVLDYVTPVIVTSTLVVR